MGETILGGSITSMLSGIFLFFCQAESLNKFGVLLLTTIISSMITALFFLPSLFYVVGPENDSGAVMNWPCIKPF